MDENEKSIIVGEIAGPLGLKGEVKIAPFTDFPERFDAGEEIYVKRDNLPGQRFTIERVRPRKNIFIGKLAGVDNISEAEKLRGGKIMISESELMPLEEDEYYIHEIIGLEVITVEGENLGKVKQVLRSPANDTYVTDRAMIPAVKEFVERIDPDEGKIIVRNVEGLIQD